MAAGLTIFDFLLHFLFYYDSLFSQYPTDSHQGNQTTMDILGKTLNLIVCCSAISPRLQSSNLVQVC